MWRLSPGMRTTTLELALVPCAARPSTGFVHLDGPCRCFVGGPAPEFAPVVVVPRFAPVADDLARGSHLHPAA